MKLVPHSAQDISLQEISELLLKHERVAILSHYRPDGDAIGSTLALYRVLQEMGKSVTALNEDLVPEYLAFLAGSDAPIITDPAGHDFSAISLVIALDCATIERLGTRLLALLPDCEVLTIDHHITNERYGDFLYLDSQAAATGEILFDLFEQGQMPLTASARDALYAAISTDTGSLQYSNATAKTYRVMSALVSMGVEVATLNAQLYFSHSPRRLEILRVALQELKISFDGQVSHWIVPYEAKRQIGVQSGDMEGLMDLLRGIAGVRVCFTLDESAAGELRLSIRSKDESVDVSKICAAFGGGGHRMAAGATLRGSFLQSRELVLAEIEKAL